MLWICFLISPQSFNGILGNIKDFMLHYYYLLGDLCSDSTYILQILPTQFQSADDCAFSLCPYFTSISVHLSAFQNTAHSTSRSNTFFLGFKSTESAPRAPTNFSVSFYRQLRGKSCESSIFGSQILKRGEIATSSE